MKVINVDGHLEEMNENGLCLMEVDNFADFRGANWLEFWKGEVGPSAREAFQNAIEGRASRFEGPCVTAKGTLKHWDVVLTPIFNESQQVIAVLSASRDISERVETEIELKKAKAAAESASRLKSEFVANISHEIRSPLNAVLGYADLLLENELTEKHRVDYAGQIKNSGSHLLGVLNDVLELSKIESGNFEFQENSFSLTELIRNSIESFGVIANKKKIELSFIEATEIPKSIDADDLRIRQIVINLLGNALKFSNQGKIVLTLSARPPNASGSANEFTLEVSDNGIGIHEDSQKRLFSPFEQSDSSITRNYGGTGLGLHLSRKLARALGGDLTLFKSAPGEGSTFIFTFSAQTTEASKATGSSNKVGQTHVEHLSGAKILLVEDALENQKLISIYLKNTKLHLDFAGNGAEAIKMCQTNDYDLILMDIMMPIMDGITATRKLRENEITTPIIALTAHAIKHEVEKCLNAGCNDHLSKPVTKTDLIDKIARILNQQADPNVRQKAEQF